MSSSNYILTRYERMLRVEKVEYVVEIPDRIKGKRAYAEKHVFDSNYVSCSVVDIPFSEKLEEETEGLRKM
ncbi:MAG: hypothetical protein V1894_04695 [Chloroflexota bacterium]